MTRTSRRYATIAASLCALTFALAAGAAPNTPTTAKAMPAKASTPAKSSARTSTTHAAKPTVAATKSGLLDGQSFSGELEKQGQTSGMAGDLAFSGGQLHAGVVDSHGFQISSYTAKQEGKAIEFHALLKSPTEGKMIWKGKVNGKTIEADVRWEKSGAAATEYRYKGATKS